MLPSRTKMRSMAQGRDAWTLTDGKPRELIELGGLVVRSDLVELTDDDRAAILGALLDISATSKSEGATRRCYSGIRAFAEHLAIKVYSGSVCWPDADRQHE